MPTNCTEDCICPLCSPKQMIYANLVICTTKATNCVSTGSVVSRGGGAFRGINTTFLNSNTFNLTSGNIGDLSCTTGSIGDLSCTNISASSLFINGVEIKSNVIQILNDLYG
jgi:hypothetical protein